MGAPLLSVVIPARGRQDDLDRAVRSVAGEQVDLEIIVVDDASPDPLVLPGELAGDKRLRLVARQANGGAGAARNTGLAMARGRLVT
ncbi:MAG: glycosyltransferase, partial [Rhizobiaceae bacterium]